MRKLVCMFMMLFVLTGCGDDVFVKQVEDDEECEKVLYGDCVEVPPQDTADDIDDPVVDVFGDDDDDCVSTSGE